MCSGFEHKSEQADERLHECREQGIAGLKLDRTFGVNENAYDIFASRSRLPPATGCTSLDHSKSRAAGMGFRFPPRAPTTTTQFCY